MIFLYFLLAIQPVIASYQHHSNSSIKCPDVVSFCPFKPPTTTFCLHFIIKSTISIPPALPPSRLFILLLLAGDINPNPGPPRCPKVTYANIRSIDNKYPAIAKFISPVLQYYILFWPVSVTFGGYSPYHGESGDHRRLQFSPRNNMFKFKNLSFFD